MRHDDPITAGLMALAESIDLAVDVDGWDQRARAWNMIPVDTEVVLGDLLTSGSVDGLTDDQIHGGIAVVFDPLALDDGELIDGFFCRDAPREAIGVIVVSEGWTLPNDRIPDNRRDLVVDITDHPARIDIRTISIQLRDGTAVTASRLRGDDTPAIQACTLRGQLGAVLRRYIGAENPPPAHSPRQLGVLRVLAAIVDAIVDAEARRANGESTPSANAIARTMIELGAAEVYRRMYTAAGHDLSVNPFDETCTWAALRTADADAAHDPLNALRWVDDYLYAERVIHPLADAVSQLAVLEVLVDDDQYTAIAAIVRDEGLTDDC